MIQSRIHPETRMSLTHAFTIGIAGGSGSGKSTAVQRLLQRLGPEDVSLLEQDAYSRHLPGSPVEPLSARNYDHLDAMEHELLARHLRALQTNTSVECPIYDFSRHCRRPETRRVDPKPWILVEGIHVLSSYAVRETLDLRLFIETDADLRLARRLRRDVRERGRTVESVLDQWEATVRPMHLAFVEPSKQFAHLVIPEAGLEGAALEVLVSHILTTMKR